MRTDGLHLEGEKVRSYLLIGQSNMAGRGDVKEVEPILNEKIVVLRMGRWQKFRTPVNMDRGVFPDRETIGVSLSESFANDVQTALGDYVGLIPCADGGTRLIEWMPGEILYENALFNAKMAMKNSALSAILWHQGESDCMSEEDVSLYKERFIKMITSLKRDLGVDVPVILGEISPKIDKNILEWDVQDRPLKLNKVFYEIESELKNSKVVKAVDLDLKDDFLHFTSTSLRILGSRYAEAYLNLIK
ncbi:MAG: sialate O-acetylesterase [Clostridia bacterium]|nr:sialate O-acetylesterase [Clostridia bacterium]